MWYQTLFIKFIKVKYFSRVMSSFNDKNQHYFWNLGQISMQKDTPHEFWKFPFLNLRLRSSAEGRRFCTFGIGFGFGLKKAPSVHPWCCNLSSREACAHEKNLKIFLEVTPNWKRHKLVRIRHLVDMKFVVNPLQYFDHQMV